MPDHAQKQPASDNLIVETIVDLGKKLKNTPEGRMTLTDVISVAELLAGTLQPVLRRIDVTLHHELRSILLKIEAMRAEISKVHAGDISSHRIPAVGKELSAIVTATEDATNAIMTSAEKVLDGASMDEVAYRELVNAEMMLIFEHCSFQDITGQRVNNVVQTIEVIEERINVLCTMMDANGPEPESVLTDAEKDRQERLLNGPSSSGVDQSAIDAMF